MASVLWLSARASSVPAVPLEGERTHIQVVVSDVRRYMQGLVSLLRWVLAQMEVNGSYIALSPGSQPLTPSRQYGQIVMSSSSTVGANFQPASASCDQLASAPRVRASAKECLLVWTCT